MTGSMHEFSLPVRNMKFTEIFKVITTLQCEQPTTLYQFGQPTQLDLTIDIVAQQDVIVCITIYI